MDVAPLLIPLERPAVDPEVEARRPHRGLHGLDAAPDLHAVQGLRVRR